MPDITSHLSYRILGEWASCNSAVGAELNLDRREQHQGDLQEVVSLGDTKGEGSTTHRRLSQASPDATSCSTLKLTVRRALDDIRGSMRELKFYRDNLFIPIEPVSERRKDDNKKSEGVAERLAEKMKAL
jgi:hypothetical protein